MTDSRYNGFSNYETWLACLWMDEDGDYWVEEAKNHRTATSLAEAIEEFWYNYKDELIGKNGLLADLINASFREIDWQEIALHIFPDEEEEEEDDDTDTDEDEDDE